MHLAAMLQRNQTWNIRSQDLWIALLPVLVFIVGEWFLSTFGLYKLDVGQDATKFSAPGEAGGRYALYGMFFLFVAVCVSATTVFFLDVRTLFNCASQCRLFAIVAGLGAIVLIVIVLGPEIWSSPKTYWFAGKTLFDDLFAQGKIEWCKIEGNDFVGTLKIVPDSCREPFSLELVFGWLLKVANVLIAVAAGSAIVGAVSCLGKPTQPSKSIVGEQLSRLNQYLYLGAALMVCGMLLILSWLHWPDFYFSGVEHPAYSTLVNGLTIYYGINYSLIVFAYYAPVAFILSQRERGAVKFSKEAPAKPARAASEAKQDLGIAATFKVVFALLSPFLTGLLGTLINLLSGGIGSH
jgi:hypothetical protein